MRLSTTAIDDLTSINGVTLPAGTRFRQLIVTGPSGSGKSTMIEKLRGWPQEGCLDLSANGWWRSQSLTLRPREVHLAVPIIGHKRAVARFDTLIDEPDAKVDTARIAIPAPKRFFFNTDWRHRYVFEFRLLPVDAVLKARADRAKTATHPGDGAPTIREAATIESAAYAAVALYLHQRGLLIYVRESFDGPPLRIDAPVESSSS